MTEADLKFYLLLKRQSKYTIHVYAVLSAALFLNSHFHFLSLINGQLSFLVASYLTIIVFSSFFRETSDQKACRIIEEYINNDQALMVKLNELRNS